MGRWVGKDWCVWGITQRPAMASQLSLISTFGHPKCFVKGTSCISITTGSRNPHTQPSRGWIHRGQWQKLSSKMAYVCIPHLGGGTCLQ